MKRIPPCVASRTEGQVPFYRADSRYIVGVNGDVAPCDVQVCGCIVRTADSADCKVKRQWTADLAHCVFNRQSNKFSSPTLISFWRGLGSLPWPFQSLPVMSSYVPALPEMSSNPRGCQTQVRDWVRMQPRISLCARTSIRR